MLLSVIKVEVSFAVSDVWTVHFIIKQLFIFGYPSHLRPLYNCTPSVCFIFRFLDVWICIFVLWMGDGFCKNSAIQFSLLTGVFDPLRSCVEVFEYLPPNHYWWGLCVLVCVCVCLSAWVVLMPTDEN
jgi:hypothetical protein